MWCFWGGKQFSFLSTSLVSLNNVWSQAGLKQQNLSTIIKTSRISEMKNANCCEKGLSFTSFALYDRNSSDTKNCSEKYFSCGFFSSVYFSVTWNWIHWKFFIHWAALILELLNLLNLFMYTIYITFQVQKGRKHKFRHWKNRIKGSSIEDMVKITDTVSNKKEGEWLGYCVLGPYQGTRDMCGTARRWLSGLQRGAGSGGVWGHLVGRWGIIRSGKVIEKSGVTKILWG